MSGQQYSGTQPPEHGERRTDPWGWLYREDGPVERVPPPAVAPQAPYVPPESYAEPQAPPRPDPQPGYGYGPPGEIPDYQLGPADPVPTGAPVTGGPGLGPGESAPEDPLRRRKRRRLMIGLIAAALALVLIIAVVLVTLTQSLNTSSGRPDPTAPPSPPASAGQPSDAAGQSEQPAGEEVYTGQVQPILPTGATAGCVAPDATDGNGDPVTYAAGNAIDGDLDTAWRCDGDGAGESLRVALPSGAAVARLGLLNGYAKVDPATDDRRYPEYRRITKVRWELSTGATFDQTLDDETESTQTLNVAVQRDVEWIQVTVTTSTAPGSAADTRDAVLISEIQVSAPA